MPRKCLIDAQFPDVSANERECLLDRLLSTRKVKGAAGPCKSSILHEVVKVLAGDEDEKQFDDLKNEVESKWRHDFIVERMGHSKEAASALTPAPIKKLRPPVAGCVLVWQVARFAFEAYWPLASAPAPKKSKTGKTTRRKTHTSTSASYKQKRTQVQALLHCVTFLWKNYKKEGGDT